MTLGNQTIYLTEYGFSVLLYRYEEEEEEHEEHHESYKVHWNRFDVILEGTRIHPQQVRYCYPQKSHRNFYFAHCPEGVTRVPSYREIVIEEVYPGISWRWRIDENGVHHEWIVKEGADVKAIRMRIVGAEVQLNKQRTKVHYLLPLGTLSDGPLYAYRERDKTPIAIHYRWIAENVIGYELETPVQETIIIDPFLELAWATVYEGTTPGYIYEVAVDQDGNVYFAGWTKGTLAFTFNPGDSAYYQGTNEGTMDAFLVKFDAVGRLLWATYYGGSPNPYYDECSGSNVGWGSESFTSLTVDGKNTLYAVGYADSDNLPVYDPGMGNYFQGSLRGAKDGFIVQFDSSGVRLWATYFGGDGCDVIYDATLQNGQLVVVGSTSQKNNFPLVNPGNNAYYDTILNGNCDYFIAVFNPQNQLIWSTFFGGDQKDCQCAAVETDAQGRIWMVGGTDSYANFPLVHSGGSSYYRSIFASGVPLRFDRSSGEGFLSLFNQNYQLIHSTFIGGDSADIVYDVAIDSTRGKVVVVGATKSPNLPVTGPSGSYQQPSWSNDTSDGFIMQFDMNVSLLWATYVGGNISHDFCDGVCISPLGHIYVTGITAIAGTLSDTIVLGPKPGPFNPLKDYGSGAFFSSDIYGTMAPDIYILGFSDSGQLIWGTYYTGAMGVFGTGNNEYHILEPGDIAVSPCEDVYTGFATHSIDLPLQNYNTTMEIEGCFGTNMFNDSAYFDNKIFGEDQWVILRFLGNTTTNEAPFIAQIINLTNLTLLNNGDTIDLLTCNFDPISFELIFSDNEGDSIEVASNILDLIPNATWVVNNNSAYFYWDPNASDAGTYLFYVCVRDHPTTSGCRFRDTRRYVFRLSLGGAIKAEDKVLCRNYQDSVRLEAQGGFDFTWTPSTGLSCSQCSNPLAAPASTTVYIVENECGVKDSVVVVVDSSAITIVPSDTLLCNPDTIQLQVVWSQCPLCSSDSITWLGLNLSCTSCSSPWAYIEGPQAYVALLNTGQCILKDTFAIMPLLDTFKVEAVATPSALCMDSLTGQTTDSALLRAIVQSSITGGCGYYEGRLSTLPDTLTWGLFLNDEGLINITVRTPFGGINGGSGGRPYGRAQVLYRKAILDSIGMQPGDIITGIAFLINGINGNLGYFGQKITYQNLMVRIACVAPDTQLPLVGFFEAPLSVVFYPKDYDAEMFNWTWIPFDVPWQWDGTSSLLIDFCYHNDSKELLGALLSAGQQVSYRCLKRFESYDTTLDAIICDYNGYPPTWDFLMVGSGGYLPITTFIVHHAPLTSSSLSYTYQWIPPTGLSCDTCQQTWAFPNGTTTYTIAVTANRGSCSSTAYDTVTIAVYGADAEPDTLVCFNGSPINVPLSAIFYGPVPPTPCRIYSATPSGTPNVSTIVKGSNALTTNSIFGPQSSASGRMQILYTKNELLAAGLKPYDIIQAIGFNVTNTTYQYPYEDFTIKIGCVEDSVLTNTWQTGLTQVYGPVIVNPSVGWNIFPLDSLYQWDGESHLLIEICYQNSNVARRNGNTKYAAVERGSSGVQQYNVGYSRFQSLCGNFVVNGYNEKPNIRFITYEGQSQWPRYQWSRGWELSCDTCANPIATIDSTGIHEYVVEVDVGYCIARDKVTILDQCSPLALLLTLESEWLDDETLLLQWKAYDQTIKYYDLQRSYDGTRWQTIYQGEERRYIETEVRQGFSYYRVIGYRRDGSSSVSNIIRVFNQNGRRMMVGDPYPNPTHQQLYIPVYPYQATSVKVILYASDGRRIFQKNYTVDKPSLLTIPMHNLSVGAYLLDLSIHQFHWRYRIIKK